MLKAKLRQFLFTPSAKRTVSLILILFIIVVTFITVNLGVKKQQTIEQHAAGNTCTMQNPMGCFAANGICSKILDSSGKYCNYVPGPGRTKLSLYLRNSTLDSACVGSGGNFCCTNPFNLSQSNNYCITILHGECNGQITDGSSARGNGPVCFDLSVAGGPVTNSRFCPSGLSGQRQSNYKGDATGDYSCLNNFLGTACCSNPAPGVNTCTNSGGVCNGVTTQNQYESDHTKPQVYGGGGPLQNNRFCPSGTYIGDADKDNSCIQAQEGTACCSTSGGGTNDWSCSNNTCVEGKGGTQSQTDCQANCSNGSKGPPPSNLGTCGSKGEFVCTLTDPGAAGTIYSAKVVDATTKPQCAINAFNADPTNKGKTVFCACGVSGAASCPPTTPGTSPGTGGGTATLTLILGLPGIGYNGPAGVAPKHLTRNITVALYDATVTDPSGPGTTALTTATGTVTFDSDNDSNAGYFVSKTPISLTLPTTAPANNMYQILVEMPQYAFQLAVNTANSSSSHAFTITNGTNVAITTPMILVPGDVVTTSGQQNHINLNDYTALLGCYGNPNGSSCAVKPTNAGDLNPADLDDNGTVDIVDINLWLRGLSVLQTAQAVECNSGDCQGD